MVDPCKPEPAVVIIGAGISGLSAAQRLAQSGISNFTVLEATDRYTNSSLDFGVLLHVFLLPVLRLSFGSLGLGLRNDSRFRTPSGSTLSTGQEPTDSKKLPTDWSHGCFFVRHFTLVREKG